MCSADSLINIALCCLGFLPGLVHAFYIILQYPDSHDYERVQDREREGTVTYYYVSHGQPQVGRQGQQAQGQANYGTVGNQANSQGQQSGVLPAKKNGQAQQGAPGQQGGGQAGEGSSAEPNGPPPTYADVIKGDHKIQKP